MIIRPLTPADVMAIELQPMQADEGPMHDRGYAETLAAAGCWTAEADGRVLACGGVVPLHQQHGLAVAMFASGIGARMVAMTRHARRAIAEAPYKRIEAMVRDDDPNALWWAELVGLQRVAKLRHWGPLDADYWLFERVR